jgi:RNA polymerase primary sigma factor
MDNITNIYLKELKNENSTKEESIELIEKARKGCSEAREQVIKNYLLMVVKIAREYMNKGVPLGDLISEGNVGLITALEKFDPSRGAPFSTCAKHWVRASIIRNCMHKNRIVRLPENVSELMRTDRWKGLEYREVSIDIPNEDGESMANDIPDTDVINIFTLEEDKIMKLKVEKILSFLNGRDVEVVKACYGIDRDEPMEIVEAAELFKLTTTRINQILRNSLKKMRVSHDSLPAAKTKDVEIISAHYGSERNSVDVTEKVVDLYLRKENVKSSNRLGGDPAPGVVKTLTVQYIFDEKIMTKSFGEGSIMKF